MSDIDLTPAVIGGPPALPLYREEHAALRDAARAFVGRELAPHADAWEEAEDFPREVFRAVAEAGFLGLKFDERWGGSGPDLLAQAVWIEELARCGSGGVAADLGAHSDLACLYLAHAGSDDQLDRWLRPSIAGESVGALGVTEPGAGSDVAGITTRARRDGDGWVLDGAKVFITNGSWCDYVVVAAKVAPGDGAPSDDPHGQVTLFVVEADTPGVERRRMSMLGWRTSHTGELTFDGVRIADDHRLGDVGGGFGLIMRNFAWERLSMSLGAVTAAEEGLAEAIAYAREREVFGRPVASFQVWRHRFADLATRIATGRALTEHALRLHVATEAALRVGEPVPVDTGELVRATSMAKLVTQRLAFDVADESVQVHGGAGYMMEYRAQRRWRDTRLGPIGGGTDEIMREIIARTYGL
ncbi:MAG: acyl-CoA dehydrogenase family protein [Actinobacteria bacterium]|nr:acyl-CoA dehydrogenase family protein [Actinomycetota bacterium]